MTENVKKTKFWLIFTGVCFMSLLNKAILAKQYSSAIEATTIIELYTSEGCSSCPPADQWLSQLRDNPGLFKDFIPLAFHVDYWNQLGWKDRFSSHEYSQRQYQHKRSGNISQVYTPGLLINNREWRGLLNGSKTWPVQTIKAGILTVDHNQQAGKLSISFSPVEKNNNQTVQVNTAILGMNLNTEVKSGENHGRRLRHDFVVLKHTQHNFDMKKADIQHWQVDMPHFTSRSEHKNALVVWLSTPDSQEVIQATGGYL